jgi:hypothetical protein
MGCVQNGDNEIGDPATNRGGNVQLLCGTAEAEVAVEVDSSRFGAGRANVLASYEKLKAE